jgi:urease accessory protein
MLEIGDLPDELRADSDPVRGGLGVGAPGKVGRLDLALAPQAGSTRVCRHYQRSPLHVYRPIYLDANRPDMAFIFLQQYGDGLVQGDRYRIDVDCAPGSAVHITTQAATKVYAARQNYAAQLVNLRAGAGAVVEYLPDPVLPFRGSRLFQRLCLTVHHEASVILGETLLPGRTAHGEAHAYDLFWTDIEVRRPDGTLLFADVLRLHPGRGDNPTSIGLLGGRDLIARCTSSPSGQILLRWFPGCAPRSKAPPRTSWPASASCPVAAERPCGCSGPLPRRFSTHCEQPGTLLASCCTAYLRRTSARARRRGSIEALVAELLQRQSVSLWTQPHGDGHD